jgi:hypothetical protein
MPRGIKQCYRVILVARRLYDIGRLCPFLRMGQPQISRWIYDPSGGIIVAGEVPHIGNIRSVLLCCIVLSRTNFALIRVSDRTSHSLAYVIPLGCLSHRMGTQSM